MSDLKAQLRAYLEDTPGVSFKEIASAATESTMVEVRRRQSPAWQRGLLVAFATAAVIVAVGLASALIFRGSDASDPVTPPAEPSATSVPATVSVPEAIDPMDPFDWAFSPDEWVTEEEMTALLEDLSERFYQDYGNGDLGGSAVLAHPEGTGEYVWGVGYWSVGIHAGGGWHPTPTETDPRLPEGVMYATALPSYTFGTGDSDETICLTVTTPGTTGSYVEEPNHERIVFEIASMLMEEMGWLD